MTFISTIKNYKDYLQCIQNWDSYSVKEQDELKNGIVIITHKTKNLKDSDIANIMLYTLN